MNPVDPMTRAPKSLGKGETGRVTNTKHNRPSLEVGGIPRTEDPKEARGVGGIAWIGPTTRQADSSFRASTGLGFFPAGTDAAPRCSCHDGRTVVDPFARRTSIHRTPPQPRRVTTLELQMRESAPVQTPLILIDVEASREGAQKGASAARGATAKARGEGARTMSCPGEVSLATHSRQEVSDRESLKDLITLIEGMKAFTVAYKNTHVALREDVAKAAIIIRRVERAWIKMEEEVAGTRVPRETGDKATQTGVQKLQQEQ
ncbi:uncharacterized protein LOC124295583 [Neodiprion lecontei]|uniref:Uncharacterized protein LOC124295583 n=1 Tax=Neodiprion lecontei TaxID=441921 RepID=A0ABM3GNX7_NEOLC|nr:uncharacterized protein LOC124295583 [Neodiprion lecontei]